jgi:hypothetical protein
MEVSIAETLDMDTDPCEVEIKSDLDIDKDEIIITTNSNEEIPNLPTFYREVYETYKDKDYRQCLEIIDNFNGDYVHYKIIKSACLIHLDEKLSEAHEILDDVLENEPNNVYVLYAKGLAYYHEKKWEESIKYLDMSINIDPNNMERAEVLRERAQEKLDEKHRIFKSQAAMVSRRSFPDGEIIRRFGCELCGHYFGKKYNLDRHNRAIHRRDTPNDFPSRPPTSRQSKSETPEKIKEEIKEKIIIKEEPAPTSTTKTSNREKPNVLGMMLKGKDKAKCSVCKKIYKRNSIARHMIIHTGNKPYKCDQCDRAFFQKSDLMRHEVSKR